MLGTIGSATFPPYDSFITTSTHTPFLMSMLHAHYTRNGMIQITHTQLHIFKKVLNQKYFFAMTPFF